MDIHVRRIVPEMLSRGSLRYLKTRVSLARSLIPLNSLARASPATETSKQISLKSVVPTSAKSAYIESSSK